jgi:hypothetical protein
MGLNTPLVQEVTPWSRGSPRSFNGLPASGRRGGNLTPCSPGVARSGRRHGATVCSRRSPPSRDSCGRCGLATPPAAIGPSSRVGGAVRRPPVTPAPDARGAFLPAAWSAAAARCSTPPWTKGGGRAIAPFGARARGARCLPLQPCRRRSGSRRRRGRGAAFPSLGSWGGAMPALVGA